MSDLQSVTEEQLAAARADLQKHPGRAAWLERAGITLEQYARSRSRPSQGPHDKR